MTPHDLIVAFDTLAEAPDGVKRLRELVLQLAVRGKLVPQDPEDEPASALAERIAKHHRDTPLPKGTRKPKLVPPATDGDLDFDLPDGWVPTRVGLVATFQYGKGLKASDRDEDGDVPVYGSNGVVGHHRVALVDTASIVIGRKGSAGALNLSVGSSWPTDVTYFVCPPPGVDLRYWFLALKSVDLPTLAGGIKPGLNRNEAHVLPVGLPPLAEQHRIVARVDELMGLLDRLEAARTARDTTRAAARDAALAALREADTPEEVEVAWNRFAERMDDLLCDPADIDRLRQAVLQLAVRGKLVRQDAGDEPASVLLERIAAEKTDLSKIKKLRKQAALSELDLQLVPFRSPGGWSWVRLDDIVDPERLVSYGVLVPGPHVPDGVGLIRVSDLHPSDPPERPRKSISPQVAEKYRRVRLRGDEVLVTVVGATIGKIGTAIPSWEGTVVARAVARFGIVPGVERRFVISLLQSPIAQEYFGTTTRTLAQPTLNVGQLRALPVPLPPLAEQHRIVARVDELMGLLDRLEARLIVAQSTHGSFASAAVHHLDA